MHTVNGGCHCGNILVDVQLSAAPGSYQPRACDCDFCRKHGAAYVSDPHGSLLIQIKDPSESGTYRQGSGQAEFLVCRHCGVLVGVFLRSGQSLYAAANLQALAGVAEFGAEQTVSPQKLSADAKVKRWQDVWFSNVEIRGEPAHARR
jgi:hypothetical protein